MLVAISGIIFIANVAVGGLSLWMCSLLRKWPTESKAPMLTSAKKWAVRLGLGALVRLAHVTFLAAGFLIQTVVSRPQDWAAGQSPFGFAMSGIIMITGLILSVIWIIGMLPTKLWDPPDGFALVGLVLPPLASLVGGPVGAWINGDVLGPLAAWAEAAVRAKLGV